MALFFPLLVLLRIKQHGQATHIPSARTERQHRVDPLPRIPGIFQVRTYTGGFVMEIENVL